MRRLFSSDFFNFEFTRVLGTAPTLGADVAECFEAASKIHQDDGDSWYQAWSEVADIAEGQARSALVSGDKITALWALLRASNYRRTSEFMLIRNPDDTRHLTAIAKAVGNFKQACQLLDTPVVPLEIPYENAALPAYLFLPRRDQNDRRLAPIILNTGGFDSIQEELYHFTASGARLRGYATLTFEGPGQGIVLRRDKLHLRPDWEVVISAVLDEIFRQAANHPDWNLDLTKVAIVGNSMGAYFALRGAAFDTRIKACVASDGFYDFGISGRERTPFFMRYLSDGVANAILGFALRFDFRTRWELSHGVYALGVNSLSAALRKIQEFTLEPPGKPPILSKVSCPVLVTSAKDSIYLPVQTSLIYDGLTQLVSTKDKVLWEPIGIGQGSMQAKVGAFSHLHSALFNWLDGVFGVKRGSI
ncbi:alpha/beta-hydrolase [Xylaria sp. FL1042]|nr:alpha/beta-hydrolase [Xylaria sp. FL1042]